MHDPRIEILDILTEKRWALYPTNKKEGLAGNISEIEDIVKKGRIKNPLDLDERRNLLLPLAERDNNPEDVFTLGSIQKHPPCYHDFEDRGIPPWELSQKEMYDSLLGVYPVDSLAYDGNLLLVFDKRYQQNSELYKNTLEFDSSDINNVLKCINRFNVVPNERVYVQNSKFH